MYPKRIHVIRVTSYRWKSKWADLKRKDDANQLASHHTTADDGYSSKSKGRELTKSDFTKKAICFDLQQCLPTPESSESFCMGLLWTLDLTIHDCDKGQTYCYLWYESLARRGRNDIGSCLYKHLFNDLDSCGGQNFFLWPFKIEIIYRS